MNKQLHHRWSLLCSGISVDKHTNNASLHNIVEEIHVEHAELATAKNPDPLNVTVNLVLVTLWKRPNPDTKINMNAKVELFDPKNKIIQKRDFKLDLPKGQKIHRYRLFLDYIPLTVSGEYTYKLSIQEPGRRGYDNVAKLPVEVNITG